MYDDKCSPCTKFAQGASWLSRGWIRTAGHHNSEEAKITRKTIFPPGFDPTTMFWIVNKTGAHGARGGLAPLVKEIIKGVFKEGKEVNRNEDRFVITCQYGHTASCSNRINIIKRIAKMLGTSAHIPFR